MLRVHDEVRSEQAVREAGGRPRSELLAVTASDMVEVDRRAVEEFGVELLQMMELAGRALARLALARFLDDLSDLSPHVVVLAGPGGNGGGALVSARRLAGWGAAVTVVTSASQPDLSPVTAHQARALRSQGVAVNAVDCLQAIDPKIDLVIDGLLGYRGDGEPRGAVREAVCWALAGTAPVLALDVPTGLDATTGVTATVCLPAKATLTLAAPKTGLIAAQAAAVVGEVYLADIGVPAGAYEGFDSTTDPKTWFRASDVIRVV